MKEYNLWDSFIIKNVKLNNRIVRSATNEHLGTLDGEITDNYIDTYKTLAKSGIGMIITSHMAVERSQRADLTHICINEKYNFEKLKQLTSEVHKYDTKIIAEISYGGHHGASIWGKRVLTPSKTDKTTEMNKEDINKCIDDYVKAINVAKETRFDGVQLHLSNGYLLSEFLDPFYNKRKDEYGGDINGRYKIIHQILKRCDKFIKDSNFLMLVKIDSTSKSKSPSFLEHQIKICKLLKSDGIDLIEVSGCDYKDYKQNFPYFLQNALKIKKSVSIPVMAVGGFRNSLQIQDAINKGIDLVSMARPFIAEENFIETLKNDKSSICINCNRCFDIYKTEFKRCIFDLEINNQLYQNFKK